MNAAPLPTTTPDAVELAHAMARHMVGPGRWVPTLSSHRSEHDRTYALLVHDESGAAVSVTTGAYHAVGRVIFRGQWPKYSDGRGYYPGKPAEEITCAATRPARDLVREIERRLLPSYMARYAEAVRDVEAGERRARDAMAAAVRIARIVGGSPVENKARPGEEVAIYSRVDPLCRLRVRTAHNDDDAPRVCFEVHDLDARTAERVLRAIARASRR